MENIIKDIIAVLSKLKTEHIYLTSFITTIGVVAVWRGLWLFLDLTIFPNKPYLSSLSSTLLGIIILLLLGAFLKDLY